MTSATHFQPFVKTGFAAGACPCEGGGGNERDLQPVMPALVAGIHVFTHLATAKTWMAWNKSGHDSGVSRRTSIAGQSGAQLKAANPELKKQAPCQHLDSGFAGTTSATHSSLCR